MSCCPLTAHLSWNVSFVCMRLLQMCVDLLCVVSGYKQHTCICFRSAQTSYNQALCVVAVKGGGYMLSCELPCVTHVCVQFHSLLWYLAVPASSKTFLRFIPFLPSPVSFFLKIKIKIINVCFITLALLWFWHKLSIKFDILVDIKAYR